MFLLSNEEILDRGRQSNPGNCIDLMTRKVGEADRQLGHRIGADDGIMDVECNGALIRSGAETSSAPLAQLSTGED